MSLISVEESDKLYKSTFITNLNPASTPNFELLDQSDHAPPSPKCNQIRKFFPRGEFYFMFLHVGRGKEGKQIFLLK